MAKANATAESWRSARLTVIETWPTDDSRGEVLEVWYWPDLDGARVDGARVDGARVDGARLVRIRMVVEVAPVRFGDVLWRLDRCHVAWQPIKDRRDHGAAIRLKLLVAPAVLPDL